jgi:hypothetical protein
MMSLENYRYFGLNAVGVRIWELLENPATVAGLSAKICEEFEVDPQTCETAVLHFAEDLARNGIVHADQP